MRVCYSLPRDICHVNERVVERGVDVRHPEHELTIRHLFEKERESTESGTVSLCVPNSRSVLVAPCVIGPPKRKADPAANWKSL
jgi:hypothetical protein